MTLAHTAAVSLMACGILHVIALAVAEVVAEVVVQPLDAIAALQ
ncbi:hypothetical protein Q4557_16495 [Shewanella sp. 5_MG-2023]|nr:hypothetical protein [Shewanella sp. 5_MG-2023]MDO6641555.1 hypothetical protein [Shewanella sp. 5_MG-2023]